MFSEEYISRIYPHSCVTLQIRSKSSSSLSCLPANSIYLFIYLYIYICPVSSSLLSIRPQTIIVRFSPEFRKKFGVSGQILFFYSRRSSYRFANIEVSTRSFNPYHSLTTSEPILILTMIDMFCQRSDVQYRQFYLRNVSKKHKKNAEHLYGNGIFLTSNWRA